MSQNIGEIKNVVVDRLKLLEIVKENKTKHDAILELAISGYWQSAQEKIEEKKQQFDKYLKSLSDDFDVETDKISNKISLRHPVHNYRYIPIQATMDYSLDLKYPEDHSDEYNRAIRSIELNVYDKIELTEQEFNQYVMNNWTWRNSFINSTSYYVSNLTGCMVTSGGLYSGIMLSGCNNIF